jgi:hypothetical protein
MKCSKLLTMGATLFLLAPAFAQMGQGKADIPFNFQIGTQTLTAGHYLVKTEGVKLQISRINGPDIATVFTISIPGDRANNGTPHLLFHCYGNEYFLSEAWLGASDRGNRLFTAAREYRLARIKSQTGETVALVREK